jgi:hypothetical protein
MRDADFDEFTELLDATCSLLSRGAYTPSALNAALWFRALAAHDLATVRAAFDAHIADPQRGRFVPVPADILAQVEGAAANDGRPGAEEAWAIALCGVDETETVVWTAETSEAWGVARPVHAAGDEVGARMAFREAYGRLVELARRSRRPVQWMVTEGHDAQRRQTAITAAVQAGRLPTSAQLELPAPREPVALLGCKAEVPSRIATLRDEFAARIRMRNTMGPDGHAKADTAALKAATAQRVRQYAAEHGAHLPPVETQTEAEGACA